MNYRNIINTTATSTCRNRRNSVFISSLEEHFTDCCLFLAQQLPVGHGLLIHEVSRSHTTHDSLLDSCGRVISWSQRPQPDNTHNTNRTNINAPGGNRTHNLSRRAAIDLRLRACGNWNRPFHRLCLHLTFRTPSKNLTTSPSLSLSI